MHTYDRIPDASPAAADSAEKLYSDIDTAFVGLVADFDQKMDGLDKDLVSHQEGHGQAG